MQKPHRKLHSIAPYKTCRRVTNNIASQGAQRDHICSLRSRPVSEQKATASHPAGHLAPEMHHAAKMRVDQAA